MIPLNAELHPFENPFDLLVVSSFVELQPWKQHSTRILNVAKQVREIIRYTEAELILDRGNLSARQAGSAKDNRRTLSVPLLAVQQLEKLRSQLHVAAPLSHTPGFCPAPLISSTVPSGP